MSEPSNVSTTESTSDAQTAPEATPEEAKPATEVEATSEAAADGAAAEDTASADADPAETTAAAAMPSEDMPAEAKAEDAEAEETKPEVAEVKAEEPKAEEPKPETAEAKAEDAKAEEPKPETAEAKAEDAKAEEPKPETAEARAEDAKAEEPKPETAEARAEDAKAEEPKPEVAEAKAEDAKAEDAEGTKGKAEAEAGDANDAKAKAEGATDAKAEGDEPGLDPALEPIIVAMEAKAPIEGKVIGWNKGGYHVALGQIAAFCPVSQIEIGNPRAPKRYLDRAFKFIVIDVAKDGRRVVVSRADALRAERKEKAAKVREVVKQGAVFEGKIRSLTDFGAFVTLEDGIEGLVHISEISRRRVDHPKELVSVGQEVKVKVLKVEKGGERISLSMKRLEADPWKTLRERFPAGAAFTGVVKRKADFGLFVEVEPGIEGLVHTSRLPHGIRLDDESLAEGATVEGWVQDIEPRRRRLALSLRPVPDAKVWDGVEERFAIGNIVEGTVERVADFGAFIELEPGLTGLLPFSELRGGKGPGGGGGGGGVNFKRQYHAGKKVTVRVLSIDVGRKRISLGTEASKAMGTQADYRDYKKQAGKSSNLGAMAAAFAKLQQ